MKQRIYAIYDLKAQMFLNPMFFIAHGQALRAFGDLANDKQSIVGQHPTDYQLNFIGTYDVITGNIEGTKPEPLGIASDFTNRKD